MHIDDLGAHQFTLPSLSECLKSTPSQIVSVLEGGNVRRNIVSIAQDNIVLTIIWQKTLSVIHCVLESKECNVRMECTGADVMQMWCLAVLSIN